MISGSIPCMFHILNDESWSRRARATSPECASRAGKKASSAPYCDAVRLPVFMSAWPYHNSPRDFVGQIFVNRANARLPHLLTIFVPKQEPAFPEIFVVGIDPATDMTICVHPRARLDVDGRANQTDRRASLECFHQGTLGFFVVDRLTS